MVSWLARLLTNVRAIVADSEGMGASTSDADNPSLPVDELNWTSGIYIAVAGVAAVLCIAVYAPQMTWDGWQGFLTLILLAVAFERVGIKIYGDTHVSSGVVAIFAIAIIYGAAGAAIAAPIVVFAATVFTASRWHTRLFDMSSYTLANVAAALVVHSLIEGEASLSGWWIPVSLLAIFVNYAVNAWLVAVLASRYSGQSWMETWREEHSWIFPYYIVFGVLALALAAAYSALQVPGIMAFVAPPLMLRFALQQYVSKTEQSVLDLKRKNSELEAANESILRMTQELTETYDGTLEALIMALDARDRETKGHSFRVAEYVMLMSRGLGIEEGTDEWTSIRRGALLHDIGKIGVPDQILHKPGPLTPEEWDNMKRHPDIGHGMLRDISFLADPANIVRCHHERFDGKGYPRGLAGDEIPIGARIFSAADAFDAMTSNRTYRKALRPEAAREEIIRHSGTQFDPKIVQAFLNAYDEFEETAANIDREHGSRDDEKHDQQRAA